MSQSLFAAALLDPDAPVPRGIIDPRGRPAPKRFAVYRNNVASSLIDALKAGFPTLVKLLGEDFFAAMALVFLRAHPPRSRILMLYGDDLPGFLEEFQPVAHLGYLPDMARVDQAMRESYHAADSAPLPDAEFQRLLGQDIASLRLTLAPSLRLVRSRWPIVQIWAANHEGGTGPKPGAEDMLILRAEFDPRPQALPPGGADFIAGLLAGKTLGESLDLGTGQIDLAAILGLLIAGRAIVGVTT
jgi:Putative DNA-binding domain